jgi:hypothetical protein
LPCRPSLLLVARPPAAATAVNGGGTDSCRSKAKKKHTDSCGTNQAMAQTRRGERCSAPARRPS